MREESKGLAMFDPVFVPSDGSLVAECVLPQIIAKGPPGLLNGYRMDRREENHS